MNNKTLVEIVLFFVVGVLVGGIASMSYFYNKGVSDSRARLEKVGILEPLPRESFFDFGKVFSKNGKEIKFEIASYDPLSTPNETEIKTVFLQSDTKLVLRVFNDTTEQGAVSFIDTEIKPTKLSVGDHIVVESDKNVIGAKEINAIKIIVTK
ncbi:MAG: hypothetical protein AAB965_03055 [Patescibacteria group bacterium]